MIISRVRLDGASLVKISGIVDSHAAGRVSDTLVESLNEGRSSLVVDLCEVEQLTRAGMRGLIVAAKLTQMSRGQMLICGASAEIVDYLGTMGIDHLVSFSPGVTAALFQLNVESSARRPAGQASQPARRSA